MNQHSRFLEAAVGDERALWDISLCRELAGLIIPDVLLGENKELIKGDVNRLWAGWYVDSFVKPEYIYLKRTYYKVFDDIYNLVKSKKLFTNASELKEFSKLLAGFVERRVQYFKSRGSAKRRMVSSDVKLHIENILSESPRCWFTGHRFPDESIDRFLNGGATKSKPLLYYDNFLPIGRKEGDLNIEIDHLLPFSRGGADDIENFKPICSHANKIKSNNCIFYDTSMVPASPQEHHYYWILRSLSLKRKCEHFGCEKSLSNERLYACNDFGGMLNPLTVRIYCSEHDTNAGSRFSQN